MRRLPIGLLNLLLVSGLASRQLNAQEKSDGSTPWHAFDAKSSNRDCYCKSAGKTCRQAAAVVLD